MANDDRAELRKLAEAATPGPWNYDVDRFSDDEGVVAVVVDANTDMLVKIETGIIEYGEDAWRCARESQERNDAAFIAAASPDVVLALLDDVARLEAALATVRARLHQWDWLVLAEAATALGDTALSKALRDVAAAEQAAKEPSHD